LRREVRLGSAASDSSLVYQRRLRRDSAAWISRERFGVRWLGGPGKPSLTMLRWPVTANLRARPRTPGAEPGHDTSSGLCAKV